MQHGSPPCRVLSTGPVPGRFTLALTSVFSCRYAVGYRWVALAHTDLLLHGFRSLSPTRGSRTPGARFTFRYRGTAVPALGVLRATLNSRFDRIGACGTEPSSSIGRFRSLEIAGECPPDATWLEFLSAPLCWGFGAYPEKPRRRACTGTDIEELTVMLASSWLGSCRALAKTTRPTETSL
jgi:hypothetical protein